MRKLTLITLIVLAFSSFVADVAGFDASSKKEIMNSWALKIFIFTDEGEFIPVKKNINNFDNNGNGSPIFVDDVIGIYRNAGRKFN